MQRMPGGVLSWLRGVRMIEAMVWGAFAVVVVGAVARGWQEWRGRYRRRL